MKPLVPSFFLLLVLPLVFTLTLQEDDLVFDDVGEESPAPGSSVIHEEHRDRPKDRDHERLHDGKRQRHVEKLWGIPDVSVAVGHVLKMKIPKQAFGGSVDHYETHGSNGKALPRWLHWDEAASSLLGVPTRKDLGQHRVYVKALGRHGDAAKDAFTIEVVAENVDEVAHKDGKTHCYDGEDQTLITILLDARLESLKPSVRVAAIENLAGFLGLHTSAISIHAHGAKESLAPDSSIILAGPGNVKRRREKHITVVQWQVGCDGHLWHHQADLVKQLREQAKDGTLAEVLQLPVLLWRVKTDSSSLLRDRREIGSGDYGNGGDEDEDYTYDDADYDAYDEDDEELDNNDPISETSSELPYSPAAGGKEEIEPETEHPHRHHHGEETIDWNVEEIDEDEILPSVNQNIAAGIDSSTTAVPSFTTTTTTTPPPTTIAPTATTEKLSSPTTPPATATTSTTTTTTTVITTTEKPTTTPPTTIPITTTRADVTITAGTTTTARMTEASPETAPTVNPNVIVTTTYAAPIPVTEPPKPETTEESSAERTNQIEIEPEINVTKPPSEPSTISPPVTTTRDTIYINLANSTTSYPGTTVEIGNARTTTEKPETKNETVVVNLTTTTTEETIEQTEPPTPPPWFVSTAKSQDVTEQPLPNTTTVSPTVNRTTYRPITTPTTTQHLQPRIYVAPTEKIEYGVQNFPPRQDRRLKKIQVTAGKPLSYIIPADTFSDLEDGNTRNLKLELYWQGVSIKDTNWLQFNRRTQEVYGLPLENDVSIWGYTLVAVDSEGLNVSDKLDVHVQMHKSSRTVNHEFSIYLRIDKRSEFPKNVDWELKVLRSIAELYGDDDTSKITVRSIVIHDEQAIFTWTNDTLPRSSACPKEQIDKLLNVLVANKNEEPSASLQQALAPEIRVKRVVYQGLGQCEEVHRPEPPRVATQEPKTNFPPVPRNQVDHINATVGQLLVFTVPEDTFFDPEDGSARNMQMSLLTIDRTPIPLYDWLQFDSKNQEFYGVPMHEDVGRKEYQLVVKDKEGVSATDGLVVVVHPAPVSRRVVEFSMTLDIPYDTFVHSAVQKRFFIEKVRDLFQDRDTSSIALISIEKGSTVVTWHNRSLPTSRCPDDEIKMLKDVLVKDDKTLTDRIYEVMGPDLPVMQITVTPRGICEGAMTVFHSPESHQPPIDDSTSADATNDDYLITFVLPAIIIAAMLILAGIIACVLYRRRRSGKMSVSEQDDERQSFRNKGIPVIFQDELDEKPDPGNKSPVILKEEKPPLPPPEYQKSEDGADVPMLPKENSEEPYQPPPPFAANRDNNRQNRPKPTPTYRKPPPYVPP